MGPKKRRGNGHEHLTQARRRGPKAKLIIEHPEPLFDRWTEPGTFAGSLDLHMRRHGDSCWYLWKAVVKPHETFEHTTLKSWLSARRIPRSANSFMILGRIERRYRLPEGHFKALLPHQTRAPCDLQLAKVHPAERRRLAWHLPTDFNARSPQVQEEILQWVHKNVLAGTTAYRRYQSEANKHPFALKFPALEPSKGTVASPAGLLAPAHLQTELAELVHFKSSPLTPLGFHRNGVWGKETSSQRIEHLALMFGALSCQPEGPNAGLGLRPDQLTFALLAFPSVWDWYLQWRSRRRGFFNTWEVDMLGLAISLARPKTGWLRQLPQMATRIMPIERLISSEEVTAARADWAGQCDRLCDYAFPRAKEIKRIARVHRDSFEPILPILESSSPVAEYRKITEEILRRLPCSQRYPRAAAEAVRAFLMLRLGLHLGLRQRNLRELLLCFPGATPRTESELRILRRGEIRWNEQSSVWEVLVPNTAFKNAHSTFFAGRPLHLGLPDLGSLYQQIETYVRVHRRVLLKHAVDPGTFFIKTVKRTSKSAAYDVTNFYQAWCLAIQRYGIWNPYTNRGAIRGLLPHGPHSVRDVIATHVLKQTGSFERASYAIQDTPEMVARHYGRFLPDDKASLAAEILNLAWE